MMKIDVDKLTTQMKSEFGDDLKITQDKFFTKLNINSAQLLNLMQSLKDDYGFNQLANVSSVDYGETFEVIYHLYSIPDNDKICVKSRIGRDAAEIDSVFNIWPAADWQEREVYDLMGIKFKGHPNLIRVLLPDDFSGHPLRKDFVMKGC